MSDSVLLLGDCLELMKDIPDKSIDLVLTDPPYGTTACKWDSVIPFEPMWAELKRITKDNAAIVLFGNEPYSSLLRTSNIEYYKYDWIWHKSKVGGAFSAKVRPMKTHENISVFCKLPAANIKSDKMIYYPQGIESCNKINKNTLTLRASADFRRPSLKETYTQTQTGYPKSILEIASESNTVHPTQKPVALLEYLIKTYTLEGETVLDFTMGSGSTGVACKNLGRKFIGIEKDENYFKIAEKRIQETA